MMTDQPPHLPEQDALQHLVHRRYGHRLSPEQMPAVDAGVDAIAEMVAALRVVPLANHDEPFTSFIPYRSED